MMKRLVLFVILLFSTSLTFAADHVISVGEKVTLSGQLVLAEGENVREQLETYQALKLNKPINIKIDGQVFQNIYLLKLWLDHLPADAFKKHQNLAVKVTGYIDYYYFGPSAFINPAKFDVIKIEKLQE